MNKTGLHDRGRPHRVDTVGQALQAVADQEEHIRHTAVAQLGQHYHPKLCRLPAAVAEPHAQDVLMALQIDPDRGIDGPVGDLAVADLDIDRVHNHRGIDRAPTAGWSRPASPPPPGR